MSIINKISILKYTYFTGYMNRLIIIIFTSCLVLFSCTSSKIEAPESEGEKLSILYTDALKKTKKKSCIDLTPFL